MVPFGGEVSLFESKSICCCCYQEARGDANRVAAEQKDALENLNERLSASMQSCAEANAIISRYDLFNSHSLILRYSSAQYHFLLKDLSIVGMN